MVERNYLVGKPRPPSPARRWIDQRVVPAAIDLAGGAECLVEFASQRTKRFPLATLAVAFLIPIAFALSVMRPSRSYR